MDPTAPHSVDDLTVREMRGIVLEELDRLGARYRTPLVLCYWEGKTRDEAAEQLGMTSNAFKKLLEQARRLLGKRLVRRGLAPSAFFATLFSTNGMQAAFPGVLIKTTSRERPCCSRLAKTAHEDVPAVPWLLLLANWRR